MNRLAFMDYSAMSLAINFTIPPGLATIFICKFSRLRLQSTIKNYFLFLALLLVTLVSIDVFKIEFLHQHVTNLIATTVEYPMLVPTLMLTIWVAYYYNYRKNYHWRFFQREKATYTATYDEDSHLIGIFNPHDPQQPARQLALEKLSELYIETYQSFSALMEMNNDPSVAYAGEIVILPAGFLNNVLEHRIY